MARVATKQIRKFVANTRVFSSSKGTRIKLVIPGFKSFKKK